MKRIFIYLILVPIIFFTPYLALSHETDKTVRKDPIFAGALSWYVPGLGQIYSEAYIKGALFWVIEESLLVGTVMSFADLKLDITRAFDLGLIVKSKESTDTKKQRTAVLLGISLITIHFINVVDAVNTTLRYNRAMEKRLIINTEFHPETNSYAFSIATPF